MIQSSPSPILTLANPGRTNLNWWAYNDLAVSENVQPAKPLNPETHGVPRSSEICSSCQRAFARWLESNNFVIVKKKILFWPTCPPWNRFKVNLNLLAHQNKQQHHQHLQLCFLQHKQNRCHQKTPPFPSTEPLYSTKTPPSIIHADNSPSFQETKKRKIVDKEKFKGLYVQKRHKNTTS